jgi:hypothetical protein
MTDKRKKRLRALRANGSMTHQAADNVLKKRLGGDTCACGHPLSDHEDEGACTWLGVPDHRPIVGMTEELRLHAKALGVPLRCPCARYTPVPGFRKLQVEQPWPRPMRVAIVAFALAPPEQGQLPELRLAVAAHVSTPAKALGCGDPSSQTCSSNSDCPINSTCGVDSKCHKDNSCTIPANCWMPSNNGTCWQ